MTKSFIAAPHVMVLAVLSVAKEIGERLTPVTPSLLAQLYTKYETCTEVPFMAGKASVGTVGPVNKFLREKGFSIQLPETPAMAKNDVACAGILDVAVQWIKEGLLTKVRKDDETVLDAVYLKNMQGYTHASHPHPIAELYTQTPEFKVYVTAIGKEVEDNFVALQQHVQKITDELGYGEKTHVTLPAVHLDVQGALDAFNGTVFATKGDPFVTTKGICQGILKLNHKGARAKAAAAGMMLRCASVDMTPHIIINGPFWFWIVYNKQVYFAAQVGEDCMRLPPDLD